MSCYPWPCVDLSVSEVTSRPTGQFGQQNQTQVRWVENEKSKMISKEYWMDDSRIRQPFILHYMWFFTIVADLQLFWFLFVVFHLFFVCFHGFRNGFFPRHIHPAEFCSVTSWQSFVNLYLCVFGEDHLARSAFSVLFCGKRRKSDEFCVVQRCKYNLSDCLKAVSRTS